ncbi:UNVERIFIED_CONTAM: hypothetical protein FKN15_056193 [Acipenser sinensis]
MPHLPWQIGHIANYVQGFKHASFAREQGRQLGVVPRPRGRPIPSRPHRRRFLRHRWRHSPLGAHPPSFQLVRGPQPGVPGNVPAVPPLVGRAPVESPGRDLDRLGVGGIPAPLEERAARHLGVDWAASEPTRRSLFELPSAQPLQSRMLPAFPDFIKEVQSTWGAPASTPATSRKAAAFNMHGASEAGLALFPPVGAAFAALVKVPTLSGLAKDPSCPNKQCRITEAHLKKGYAAATEAVRLSNVASLLTVYQAALLRDLPECPSAALRTELGTVAQLLVKLAQLNARAQGRSIASLVVARRQLWLSQARVQEPDKVPLLDAPISPGHTFGPAVEEMLQRCAKAREASQQLAKMWPSKPFQPRRPQERQWRRAPPQQQAQSRGSMTAPSGVSARGQPAFVRPQRGGWRPRGGGKPRPRGSGQAPRERAQPKQP